MGQGILNPPSVEGWHGAEEWVNTGAMMQRVNYASKVLGDVSRPGVTAMLEAVKPLVEDGDAGAVVDECLSLLGYLELDDETREAIVNFAREQIGGLSGQGEARNAAAGQVVVAVLQLCVATREFQLA